MKSFGSYLVSFLLCMHIQALYSQQELVGEDQGESIFLHTVERGQTVYSISLMYGVDEADIYRLNPLSREVIKAGETLKIPQKDFAEKRVNDDEMYLYHTIETGETLYGVSRRYGLSAEDLSDANRGLTPLTFSAGKTIRIPSMKIHSLPVTQTKVVIKEMKYKIKRKETMYSICRRFNLTGEELVARNPALKSGLKAGMELIIPVKTEEVVTEVPEQREINLEELVGYRQKIEQTNSARIALLLPFHKFDAKTPLDTRVIEFYEGFLMAVDSIRNRGMSVELYVNNIGDDMVTTNKALENIEIERADLIIGGMTDEQIERIADYAEKHEIKYIVPFSSRCERLTMENPFVFQVNTLLQNLYSYLTPRIRALFPQHRIILINTNDSDRKTQFANVLKADLNDNGIHFEEIAFHEKTFKTDISGLLSNTAPNLVIPLSGSLDALLKIKGTLRSIIETKPKYAITLFGHPEWQAYTKDCLDDFYALDARFYTTSYMNAMTPEANGFTDKYKALYFKPLPPASPRYAALGFDMGFYFLTAVRTYGRAFDNYMQLHKCNSIQSGFRFERVNNWGGFLNTNLYIVHFNKEDHTIRREE
ncbi:MAG: LysM peptidoglycan-binding domain-containing protein [Tannerella sp.]|jgi:LysM repeat protein|nr:LysM peptidoglycan-binding domain-containing protein [Tannerella sp.]